MTCAWPSPSSCGNLENEPVEMFSPHPVSLPFKLTNKPILAKDKLILLQNNFEIYERFFKKTRHFFLNFQKSPHSWSQELVAIHYITFKAFMIYISVLAQILLVKHNCEMWKSEWIVIKRLDAKKKKTLHRNLLEFYHGIPMSSEFQVILH